MWLYTTWGITNAWHMIQHHAIELMDKCDECSYIVICSEKSDTHILSKHGRLECLYLWQKTVMSIPKVYIM